jgi:hypothetical protein
VKRGHGLAIVCVVGMLLLGVVAVNALGTPCGYTGCVFVSRTTLTEGPSDWYCYSPGECFEEWQGPGDGDCYTIFFYKNYDCDQGPCSWMYDWEEFCMF